MSHDRLARVNEQDPYVRIRIGAAEVKTETQSSGHTNPRWNGTPFFLYVQHVPTAGLTSSLVGAV